MRRSWHAARIGSSLAWMISNYGYSITFNIQLQHSPLKLILIVFDFLTVSPTASFVLTGSHGDDMSIKAWDCDKTWKIIQSKCTHGYESVPNKFYEQTYKGPTRYITESCLQI